MVIFYDISTREIKYTERDVMTPQLLYGSTSEKVEALEEDNIGFISVPYEMDLEVFDYLVCLDEKNNFIGLQPKSLEN